MSSEVRGRLTARRGWLLALAGGALAIGSAGAALAQNQVINAGTNAQQAADALNEGCADMEKCDWDTTSVTSGWGPPKIVGDKLYNCSASAEAETATDATDTRSESTSLSESIALQISVGLSEVAQESAEFKAFTNQTQGFSTGVGVSSTVPVSAGYVGWTEAQVPSILVTGNASITQGIHIGTEVTGIDLTLPTGSLPVSESSYSQGMSAQDIANNCAKIPPLPAGTTSSVRAAIVARAAAAAQARVPQEKPFKLTICQSRRGPDPCTRRTVKGRLPERHNLRRVTATLERSGRVHARDKNRRGGIRLTVRRDIKAGRYRLIVRKKPRTVTTRDKQGKRYRAIVHRITIVPVTVRWHQKK